MDKNKLHVVIGMAVASLGVICLGHVVSAGNDWSTQTEKPLAGLAVSFDKYCEAHSDNGDPDNLPCGCFQYKDAYP